MQYFDITAGIISSTVSFETRLILRRNSIIQEEKNDCIVPGIDPTDIGAALLVYFKCLTAFFLSGKPVTCLIALWFEQLIGVGHHVLQHFVAFNLLDSTQSLVNFCLGGVKLASVCSFYHIPNMNFKFN